MELAPIFTGGGITIAALVADRRYRRPLLTRGLPSVMDTSSG